LKQAFSFARIDYQPGADMAKPSSKQAKRNEAIIEQRLGELIVRYGDRWSEQERALIRALRLSDALRRVPLTNADEPGNVFKPIRAGEGQ
jgi:hypothetical protein